MGCRPSAPVLRLDAEAQATIRVTATQCVGEDVCLVRMLEETAATRRRLKPNSPPTLNYLTDLFRGQVRRGSSHKNTYINNSTSSMEGRASDGAVRAVHPLTTLLQAAAAATRRCVLSRINQQEVLLVPMHGATSPERRDMLSKMLDSEAEDAVCDVALDIMNRSWKSAAGAAAHGESAHPPPPALSRTASSVTSSNVRQDRVM